MITRLQVEKEWDSFSQSYQPLRVSYPSGQQVSTYRLQLPYSLSVPLIGISILFHWLASSAIFLYIVDGGTLIFWCGTTDGRLTGSRISLQWTGEPLSFKRHVSCLRCFPNHPRVFHRVYTPYFDFICGAHNLPSSPTRFSTIKGQYGLWGIQFSGYISSLPCNQCAWRGGDFKLGRGESIQLI